MTKTTTSARKRHALTDEILAALVIPERGELAHLPDAALARFTAVLHEAHDNDAWLCLSLVDVSHQLSEGGLRVAAGQVLGLARQRFVELERTLAFQKHTAEDTRRALQQAKQTPGKLPQPTARGVSTRRR